MNAQKAIVPGRKNIVICSDGTGNSANKDRGTNVFRLYEAVDLLDPPPNSGQPKQIAIYDDGVGTETFKPLRVLGGAFGLGLSRNVRELYAALVRSYAPGDRIFLFGFSRGAFTVRTLGGLVTTCGILRNDPNDFRSDADLVRAVEDTYGVYRSRYMTGIRHDVRRIRRKHFGAKPRSHPFDARLAKLRAEHPFHESNRIEFIGVWDTVDALGLPFDHLADLVNYAVYPFKFADRTLGDNVGRARHALSIDDERHTFHPVMWDADGSRCPSIEQVWFAGVHSNVGGGYPKQGMSLVSLEWMMAEAAAGKPEDGALRFVPGDRDYCLNHANVNDKLYNSRAGIAVYYRYKPRDIHEMCRKQAHTEPKVHESVIDRITQRTEGYAPGNLPRGLKLVTTGNAPLRHPGASAIIERGYGGTETSLLDRAKGLVWLRRWAYAVYLVLTVAALGVALEPRLAAEQGFVAKLAALSSVDYRAALFDALKHSALFDVLVASIAVWFAISIAAERAMRGRFSQFWHSIMRPLSGEAPAADRGAG